MWAQGPGRIPEVYRAEHGTAIGRRGEEKRSEERRSLSDFTSRRNRGEFLYPPRHGITGYRVQGPGGEVNLVALVALVHRSGVALSTGKLEGGKRGEVHQNDGPRSSG